MGRAYGATTDRITAGQRATPSEGSMLLWLYPTWAQDDGVTHVFFDNRSSIGQQNFTFQKFSDNKLYFGWFNTATDYSVVVASAGYTLNQNAWNCFVGRWIPGVGGFTQLWLNGTQIGANATPPVTFSNGLQNRTIGNYFTGTGVNNDARGTMAMLAFWSTRLSDEEIATLAGGAFPTAVGGANAGGTGNGLADFWPLWGQSSPEPNWTLGDTGVSTPGIVATIASGTSEGANPNIWMPTPRPFAEPPPRADWQPVVHGWW